MVIRQSTPVARSRPVQGRQTISPIRAGSGAWYRCPGCGGLHEVPAASRVMPAQARCPNCGEFHGPSVQQPTNPRSPVAQPVGPRSPITEADARWPYEHVPYSDSYVVPVTRVRRRDSLETKQDGAVRVTIEGWECSSGVPIAQVGKQMLVVINNHFSKSNDCLLGDNSDVKGTIVARDPKNDLALIVGEHPTKKMEIAELGSDPPINSVVQTLAIPRDRSVKVRQAKISSADTINQRFVQGESGGGVFRNKRLVGVISATLPKASELKNLTPGQVSAISEAERDGLLGRFVPVSKVRSFVAEASQTLALDYPVFTTFLRGGASHESTAERN